MAQHVHNPDVVIFWLREMPRKPKKIRPYLLWLNMKDLKEPVRVWGVLRKTGRVYRAGDRRPAIQDPSGIYKIIGPVKNEEDNRHGTMELSLRRFIRGTVGAAHLKEGLPTHSADQNTQFKMDAAPKQGPQWLGDFVK